MKKMMFVLLTVFLVGLVMSTEIIGVQAAYRDPEDYEAKQFIPVLDIWVNESSAALMQVQSVTTNAQPNANVPRPAGWVLRHYFIVPDNNMEWMIHDPNVKVVKGFLGEAIHHDDKNNMHVAAVETSDPGYENFDYRDVETVNHMRDSEILKTDTASVIDLNSDYMNASTEPTAMNYTFPDLETDGVYYFADDSKSAVDYAKDMAEADGTTFYNLVNASAVAFAYDDTYKDLDSVVWAFDDVASTATYESMDNQAQGSVNVKLQGFTLKRYRISLHQVEKTLTSLGGKVTKTIKNTDFKKLGKAAIIAASPAGAAYFLSKKIGSAFHFKPMKVGSLASGVFKSFTNILIAAVVGIVLILILVFIIKLL